MNSKPYSGVYRHYSRIRVDTIYFPNARFRKMLDPFFITAKSLIDYAHGQGWYDLSGYYKLIETPSPDTGHQEYMYLFEHHTLFTDLIARYRIEKNLV